MDLRRNWLRPALGACFRACGMPARYRATRRFRHMLLCGINVHLVYAPRQVVCERCGGVHVEAMPWVSGKPRFTRAQMVTLASWARILTWKEVAKLFHCSWSTAEAAVDEAVAYGMAHQDLSGLDSYRHRRDLRQAGPCVRHQWLRPQTSPSSVGRRGPRQRDAGGLFRLVWQGTHRAA